MILDLVLDHERTYLVLVRQFVDIAERNAGTDLLGQDGGGRQEFGGEGPRRALVPRVRRGDEASPWHCSEVMQKDRPRQPESILSDAAAGGRNDDRSTGFATTQQRVYRAVRAATA